MSKKPWSEHDLRMLSKLSELKNVSEQLAYELNMLQQKIEQKYQTEQETVKLNGRY